MIAQSLAAQAPGRVRSLTLIEPVLFAAAPDPANDARMAEIAELAARYGGELEADPGAGQR